MAQIDLTKYGINGAVEVVHNPSYEQLFAEETKPGLEGFEVGQVTELGAVNVMTGVYTGRSPKDKFIVKDATSENTVWWTSEEYKNDNKPVTTEAWNVLKEIATKELSNKKPFGWLYRKYGLRYAMIAHGGCHILSKLIWILFI